MWPAGHMQPVDCLYMAHEGLFDGGLDRTSRLARWQPLTGQQELTYKSEQQPCNLLLRIIDVPCNGFSKLSENDPLTPPKVIPVCWLFWVMLRYVSKKHHLPMSHSNLNYAVMLDSPYYNSEYGRTYILATLKRERAAAWKHASGVKLCLVHLHKPAVVQVC